MPDQKNIRLKRSRERRAGGSAKSAVPMTEVYVAMCLLWMSDYLLHSLFTSQVICDYPLCAQHWDVRCDGPCNLYASV